MERIIWHIVLTAAVAAIGWFADSAHLTNWLILAGVINVALFFMWRMRADHDDIVATHEQGKTPSGQPAE